MSQGSGFVFGLFANSSAKVDGDRLFPLGSFAFGVLPTVIVFSSLMAVLYHLGIMQLLVRGVAWGMQRTLGTSGPETLAAANIFVRHTEAPLVVRPYLEKLSKSELNALMVGGFATVTGSLLATYALIGVPWHEAFDAGRLLGIKIVANEIVAYEQMGELLSPANRIRSATARETSWPTPYAVFLTSARSASR